MPEILTVGIGTTLEAPTRAEIDKMLAQVSAALSRKGVPLDINPRLQNGQIRIAINNLNDLKRASDALISPAERLGRTTARTLTLYAGYNAVLRVFGSLNQAMVQNFQSAVRLNSELRKVAQLTSNNQFTSSIDLVQNTVGRNIGRLRVDFAADAQELAKAAQFFAQAGRDIGEINTLLDALAATNLTATFGSLQQTAESTEALFRQFNLGVTQARDVFDSFNAVSKEFNVSVSEINQGLSRGGAAFAALSGITELPAGSEENLKALQEFTAIFTTIIATTRESAATVGTSIRTLLPRLQRTTTRNTLADIFGPDFSLEDAEGQFVGPFEALLRISREVERIDISPTSRQFSRLVEALGGVRQFQRVIPILTQASDAQRALEIQQRSQGSVARDVAQANEDFAVQLERLNQRLQELFVNFTRTGTFERLAEIFIDGSEAAIRFADAIAPLIPLIAALSAIPIARGIGQLGKGLIGGFGSVGFAQGGLVNAALTPGELVIGPQIAKQIGLAKLQRANKTGNLSSALLDRNAIVKVPGVGNQDTVPATLEAGSFVIKKPSAEKLLGFNRGGRVGLQTGGFLLPGGGPAGSSLEAFEDLTGATGRRRRLDALASAEKARQDAIAKSLEKSRLATEKFNASLNKLAIGLTVASAVTAQSDDPRIKAVSGGLSGAAVGLFAGAQAGAIAGGAAGVSGGGPIGGAIGAGLGAGVGATLSLYRSAKILQQQRLDSVFKEIENAKSIAELTRANRKLADIRENPATIGDVLANRGVQTGSSNIIPSDRDRFFAATRSTLARTGGKLGGQYGFIGGVVASRALATDDSVRSFVAEETKKIRDEVALATESNIKFVRSEAEKTLEEGGLGSPVADLRARLASNTNLINRLAPRSENFSASNTPEQNFQAGLGVLDQTLSAAQQVFINEKKLGDAIDALKDNFESLQITAGKLQTQFDNFDVASSNQTAFRQIIQGSTGTGALGFSANAFRAPTGRSRQELERAIRGIRGVGNQLVGASSFDQAAQLGVVSALPRQLIDSANLRVNQGLDASQFVQGLLDRADLGPEANTAVQEAFNTVFGDLQAGATVSQARIQISEFAEELQRVGALGSSVLSDITDLDNQRRSRISTLGATQRNLETQRQVRVQDDTFGLGNPDRQFGLSRRLAERRFAAQQAQRISGRGDITDISSAVAAFNNAGSVEEERRLAETIGQLVPLIDRQIQVEQALLNEQKAQRRAASGVLGRLGEGSLSDINNVNRGFRDFERLAAGETITRAAAGRARETLLSTTQGLSNEELSGFLSRNFGVNVSGRQGLQNFFDVRNARRAGVGSSRAARELLDLTENSATGGNVRRTEREINDLRRQQEEANILQQRNLLGEIKRLQEGFESLPDVATQINESTAKFDAATSRLAETFTDSKFQVEGTIQHNVMIENIGEIASISQNLNDLESRINIAITNKLVDEGLINAAV